MERGLHGICHMAARRSAPRSDAVPEWRLARASGRGGNGGIPSLRKTDVTRPALAEVRVSKAGTKSDEDQRLPEPQRTQHRLSVGIAETRPHSCGCPSTTERVPSNARAGADPLSRFPEAPVRRPLVAPSHGGPAGHLLDQPVIVGRGDGMPRSRRASRTERSSALSDPTVSRSQRRHSPPSG